MQVLPRDKREVVSVLRETYGLVVGMTGDGTCLCFAPALPSLLFTPPLIPRTSHSHHPYLTPVSDLRPFFSSSS